MTKPDPPAPRRRPRRGLLLAALLCLAPALARGAEAADLWRRVWANDFALEVPPDAPLPALEAGYYAAKERADYATAFELALAGLRRRAAGPESLVDLDRVVDLAPATGRRRDLYAALGDLLARDDLHPALALAIRRQRLELAFAFRDAPVVGGTADWLGRHGAVRIWARVAGPFRRRRPFQLDDVAPVEADPAGTDFTDALGRSVTVRRNVRTDIHGTLRLADHLPQGRAGAAYALALLIAEEEGPAVLSFTHGGNLKAWLNGLPVYRSDQYAGYALPRHLRAVRLRRGANLLLLRSTSGAYPAVQVLTAGGGAHPGVRARPWAPEAAAAAGPVRAVRGQLASTAVEAFHLDRSAAAADLADPLAAGRALRRVAGRELAGQWQEARTLQTALEAARPASVLALVDGALFRFREATQGVDAPERLEKEAYDLVRAALERRPEDPRAHFLAGTYQRDRNQPEEALEHFRQAVASAPSWSRAHLEFAALAERRGLTALAERHLRAALDRHAEARVRLANLLRNQNRHAEADRLFDAAWEAGELSVQERYHRLLEREEWQAAQALLEVEGKLRLHVVPEAETMRRLLTLQRRRGDLAAALQTLQGLAAEESWNASLCREAGNLALRLGDEPEAVARFRQSLDRRRRNGASDAALRRRLRHLAGRPWPPAAHDLELAGVETAGYVKEAFPAANHATLLAVTVHVVQEDRSVETLHHRAVKIFDKRGMAALGEMRVPSDPDNLLYIHTIGPDGSVFAPTNLRELDFTDAASMYRVEPGSTLEYAFREVRSGRDAGQDFVDRLWFQEYNVPTARARCTVVLPAAWREDLSVQTWPRDWSPREEEAGASVVLTWDAEHLPPVRPEPQTARREETLANLSLRLRTPDFGDQAGRLARPAPLATSPAVAARARAVAGERTDPEAILRALHAWLRESVDPVAAARTPRDVLALRSGDAYAVQELMRAFLTALEIPVRTARANTDYRRPRAFPAERGEAADAFYTPLLQVQTGPAERRWLRFFSAQKHFRPADLGRDVPGAPAVVLGEHGLRMLDRVRAAALEERRHAYDLHLALAPSGDAAVRGAVTLFHTAAAGMRRVAARPQEGPRRLEGLATGLYPRLEILDSAHGEPEAPDGADAAPREAEPFVYTFTGRLRSFGREEGEGLGFAPFPYPFNPLVRYLAPPDREQPFLIGTDVEESQVVRYTAPEGWTFTTVPPSCWWSSPYGLYVTHYIVAGRDLWVSRFLLLPATTVTAAEYPALASFLEACRQAESEAAVGLAPLPAHGGAWEAAVIAQPLDIADRQRFRPRWWPRPGPGPAPRPPDGTAE